MKQPGQEYQKLEQGVREIQRSSPESLKDLKFLANIIREIGLSYDPRQIYGDDNRFMNPSRLGLWQHPVQLAKTLIYLSDLAPASFLEIGTFKGFTTTVFAAYLRRFNPECKVTSIDPVKHIDPHPIWQELKIEYLQTDSSKFAGQKFDVCFIDGDHSFEAVASDYQQVGKYARVCIFHDINEELCPDVELFWNGQKSEYSSTCQTLEFLDHSENRKIMGIGILKFLGTSALSV